VLEVCRGALQARSANYKTTYGVRLLTEGRFDSPVSLQFLAVSCSPTAFFEQLYTSEQGSFSGSRLRTDAPSSQPRTRRHHKAWGANPRNRRCGIVPLPSPPHIPKHRFLRQLRSFPFDARCCISREHLVKRKFGMKLHHNIRFHNRLRAEPPDGRLGSLVTFLGFKSLAGSSFGFASAISSARTAVFSRRNLERCEVGIAPLASSSQFGSAVRALPLPQDGERVPEGRVRGQMRRGRPNGG
jgi:hypothetical protein